MCARRRDRSFVVSLYDLNISHNEEIREPRDLSLLSGELADGGEIFPFPSAD